MATEGGVRVLLADDDEDFLVSLRELIEAQRELSVVAVATNWLSAIKLVDKLAPDAVVLELHMQLLDDVTKMAPLDRIGCLEAGHLARLVAEPAVEVAAAARAALRAGAALRGEGFGRGRRARQERVRRRAPGPLDGRESPGLILNS